MSIYKRGEVYWYKFMWNGEVIRQSTRQTNQNIARQMEAAHQVALAKGEVGIRRKESIPTLAEFIKSRVGPRLEASTSVRLGWITIGLTWARSLDTLPWRRNAWTRSPAKEPRTSQHGANPRDCK